MSVISFLHDLGIIPNEGTGLEDNENLLQGQKYMEYGRLYAKSVHPHLASLQTTSSPDIGSITESMNGMNSVNATTNHNNSNEISENEKEFNKNLNEYAITYKTLSEDILNKKEYNQTKNKSVMQHLTKLNKKIISLAEKINNELSVKLGGNKELNKNISNKQSQLKKYIHKMSDITKDNETTINGMEESSRLNAISNYLFYLVWFIVVIIVIILLLTGMNSNSMTTLILISLLFILFLFYMQ
jgi:hypothetical protein